jgi:hypothetical protein
MMRIKYKLNLKIHYFIAFLVWSAYIFSLKEFLFIKEI